MNVRLHVFALSALAASAALAGDPETIFSDHFEAGTSATARVSGTITGLDSDGLRLTLNGAEELSPAANDTRFLFTTAIPVGGAWTVAISAQPSGSESCDIRNNRGTLPAGGVDDVAVSCGGPTTIGGTVSGLPTAGRVTLRLTVDTIARADFELSSNGPYQFLPPPVAVGSDWSVSVVSSPLGQTCLLSNSSGTVPVGGIADADVNCRPTTANTLWDQFNWDQANWE